MKLSPPASSSDLDAAREIARRLHQHRRREDRPALEEPADGPQPAPWLVPPPLPVREASPRPAPPRPVPSLEPPLPPRTPEPGPLQPPSWDEPGGPDAPALDAFDALAGIGEPERPEEPSAPVDVGDLAIEEPPVSPEEMVGAPGPPLDHLTDGGPVPPSPFDMDLDEPPDEPPAEDMVEIPTGPSWDEVVAACLDASKAGGAMIIDPAGQVFASRGEWPKPGPEAIAAKLVSNLDRMLKDEPTRSISAPLLGKQLTAWRVPLAEGLVTAAFIGDAPVRAEARPAIDAEIHRGPGA